MPETLPPAAAAGPLRRALDALYRASAALAGVAMVLTLLAILASIFGRLLRVDLTGMDAYAGYAMAAAAFLALGPTFKRGEHIRVTLLLERLSPGARRLMERLAHLLGLLLATLLAWFSVRLVLQSRQFNDVSQGMDATPLWIPQLAMALGACVLVVAVLDDLWAHWQGRTPTGRVADAGPAHLE